MWVGIVGFESAELFKTKEDVNMNAYCKFLNQHFTEWLHDQLLVISVRLSTYEKQ